MQTRRGLNLGKNGPRPNEPVDKRLATRDSNHRAMSFDSSGLPRYVPGYTGHVPGRRWIYGRPISGERAVPLAAPRDRSVDRSRSVEDPTGRVDSEFALANRVPTSQYHRHSRIPRPPTAHLRRFQSVESLRDMGMQSEVSMLNGYAEPRYKNASANIPDAPPTPPDRYYDKTDTLSTTATGKEDTDSGISNDHPRETSSNSHTRSSSYSRWRHHARHPLFSAGIPATGYTGYVPGWKQVVGKSFSSSLQQIKQRELARMVEQSASTAGGRRSARPSSRSGARYRSASEHRP